MRSALMWACAAWPLARGRWRGAGTSVVQTRESADVCVAAVQMGFGGMPPKKKTTPKKKATAVKKTAAKKPAAKKPAAKKPAPKKPAAKKTAAKKTAKKASPKKKK